MHLVVAVGLKGIVRSSIQRVFYMYAEALVLGEVGIRQQDGPVTLGIAYFERIKAAICLGGLSTAGVEQEEVIPSLVVMFIFRILGGQTCQRLFAETQVVKLVLEDDASMEQAVFNKVVALSNLLFGKRYLCQIVLALVGVEGRAVGRCFAGNGVFGGFYGVRAFLGVWGF